MMLERYKLELIKDKTSVELQNHPIFLRLLQNAFKNIEETMDFNSKLKIEEFNNGNIIRICTTGTCKDTKTELRNNRDFVATTITLNDDNTISLDVANGTLFKASDLREVNEKIKDNTSAVLNTYYTNSIYDENGVQLSHSSFGDNYELMGEFKKINIESHIMTPNAHKPKFFFEEVKLPNLCENAYMEHAHREKENLAIVYTDSLNGIKTTSTGISVDNIEKSIYLVSPKYASTLGAFQEQVAEWSQKKQEYELTTYEYGTDLENVKEVLKESLQITLEMNQKQDSNIYKSIVEAKKTKIK